MSLFENLIALIELPPLRHVGLTLLRILGFHLLRLGIELALLLTLDDALLTNLLINPSFKLNLLDLRHVLLTLPFSFEHG